MIVWTATMQMFRGIGRAVRARAKVVAGVTAAVAAFNLLAPVAILSIARRPPDFVTFNPWLRRLPDYLKSDEPWGRKLEFLSNMAIGWVSADNKVEGIDWGFIVDTPTLGRILVTSLIFGTYFALWSYRRRHGAAGGLRRSRPAGGRPRVHRAVQQHAHDVQLALADQHRRGARGHGAGGDLAR